MVGIKSDKLGLDAIKSRRIGLNIAGHKTASDIKQGVCLLLSIFFYFYRFCFNIERKSSAVDAFNLNVQLI